MKHYAVGKAREGTHYVYRVERYKVMARCLSRADAQLIAKALNNSADEEQAMKTAIDYKIKHGDMW